jgi:hypothetical protein
VKTEEDVRIIKNSLERDSLFTTLDEEQIRAFIQVCLHCCAPLQNERSRLTALLRSCACFCGCGMRIPV